jgi:ribosomal protein L37AE/L43A
VALALPLTSREHTARRRARGLWKDRTCHDHFAAAARAAEVAAAD